MPSEPDPASKTFIEVALQRELLTDEQARALLHDSSEQSVDPSQLAVETGILESVEVEIVEAFVAPGDLAPGYELLDVLGYGALGVVYRARQPRLQRDVAVKSIMQSRVAQQNVIARFQQEGAAIGRLQHPNIVSAYDSGTHRSRLYLVMELVDGSDLSQRLDQGPLDSSTALSILRQTASGLSHALAQGIIHRDIKPGNLILTEAPAGFDLPAGVPLVKIADFGLARLNPPTDPEQQDTRLTLTGSALGTPMYCAPEQLTGDEVDHRADIYALGATLFRMLSGEAPFATDKVSKVIAAKVTGQLPNLESLPKNLDPEVRQLLLDMMAHDPEDRVPDYETLIRRIDQIQGHGEASSSHGTSAPSATAADTRSNVTTSSTSRVTKSSGWTGKRLWVPALLGLLLVALGTLAAPHLRPSPAVPMMVPSGWEAHLFDGKTVTGWTKRIGLWHGGVDVEGGAILVGKGSAVRVLPTPKGKTRPSDSFGVRIGVDLQNAESAEVHFGIESLDRDDSQRLVARYAVDRVSLGSKAGIDGDFSSLGFELEPPKSSEDDVPSYHELRIELHGEHWFVYFDGKLLGDAAADPVAENRAIQLVAPDSAVHFAGPGVFGLQSP